MTLGSVVRTDVDPVELETFGSDPAEERTRSRTVRESSFNAMVSSIQLLLALVTTSFAVTVTTYFATGFDANVNLITLIVYMSTGLVVMALFRVHRDHLLLSRRHKTKEDADDISRDGLALAGMATFYVTGCLLDTCHVIASVGCDWVWRRCNDRYIYTSYVWVVVFHVLRIAYLGAQTLFCFAFNRSTFSDRPVTRYGLAFLQAANLSLWFDALVHESSHMFNHRPRQDSFYRRCLGNASNVTVETLGCVYHNNGLYKISDAYIGSTFLPFTIEFTLLVGEFLLHLYFHCGGAAANVDSPGTSSHFGTLENQYNEQVVLQDLPGIVAPELKCEDEGEERKEVDVVSVFKEDSDVLIQRNNNSNNSPVLLSCGFVFFVVSMNVVLCSLALMVKLNVWTNGPLNVQIFRSYAFVFWISMLVSMMVGYCVSGTLRYRSDLPYNGLEYLLLVTSVGPLAFDVFTLIAATGTNLDNTADTVSFQAEEFSTLQQVILEISNGMEVYFQAGFCIFARRILISGFDVDLRAKAFRCVVLFLAVSNGSFWLVGSLSAYESSQTLQVEYFGKNKWKIINNIVVPLSLFYRFNSCLLLTKIHFRMLRRYENDA